MIRLLVFFLVCLSFISCDDHFFTYKGGKLVRGSEKAIFGRVDVEAEENGSVEIDGTYLDGKVIPFGITFTVEQFSQAGDQISVSGKCRKAVWAGQVMKPLEGSYKITGTWEKSIIEAECTDPATKEIFSVKLEGTSYECQTYKPVDASNRAQYLIGQLRENFSPVQVLIYSYYDYPYLNVMRGCRHFLGEFGDVTTEQKPGYAIVGKDGMHCAIINKEGDMFIHSSPVKQQIVATPLPMLKDYFKSGWVIKTVPCEGPH